MIKVQYTYKRTYEDGAKEVTSSGWFDNWNVAMKCFAFWSDSHHNYSITSKDIRVNAKSEHVQINRVFEIEGKNEVWVHCWNYDWQVPLTLKETK